MSKAGRVFHTVQPPCPNERKHTKAPDDYLAWHEWAEKKSKTHTQIQCPDCNLWVIWVLRK